MKIKLSKH